MSFTGRQEYKGYKKNCNCRPIKNYTTTVPANRSIADIQDALVQHGATGLLYKYEQGTGRIEALQFLLRIKNQDVAFSLAAWRNIQKWRKASFCWGMGGRNNKTPVLPTRTGACSEDLTVQCEGQPQRAKESIKDAKQFFNPLCEVPHAYRIRVGEEEAHLLALCCSQAPEGHERWT